MSDSNIRAEEFQTDFTYSVAIPCEEGVTRRDPSPVIKVGGLYYVWYSRSTVDAGGYAASIWYATSRDGKAWTEQAEAISKGGAGAWDENGVFTPTTLTTEGRFYLYYTGVPKPFYNGPELSRQTKTAIGAAVADSPEGPWKRCESNPILRPGENPRDFDSHRVDDSCLIVRDGRYWMYYKGRQLGLSPRETKMGLAIADAPLGPFVKHENNPVLASGHEVCVWPHREGVGALVAPVGPEGKTVQYSPDGIHFTKMADVEPPMAPGPYRSDHYCEGFGEGITWGLCQKVGVPWPYLLRFECDLSVRKS
jgi:beta-xylosidase